MSETIKVEIEIPAPPEGWVFDGYRQVKANEMYFYAGKWVEWVSAESSERYPVAIRCKRYREPSLPADEWEVCEFSDNDGIFYVGMLKGYLYAEGWLDENETRWDNCRIEVSE